MEYIVEWSGVRCGASEWSASRGPRSAFVARELGHPSVHPSAELSARATGNGQRATGGGRDAFSDARTALAVSLT